MPKVYLNQDNGYSDITSYISRISWRGSKSEAARRLDIDLVNSILDKNVPKLYIKNGSILKLFDDTGTMLFMGFVFFNERLSSASTVTVTAYDHLIYLLKSRGTYNFNKRRAEDITHVICNDFQIKKGTIAQTGISQSFIAKGKKLYDIIMQAYTAAALQTGKKYMPRMNDGKLDVVEVGSIMSDFMLSDESNILDSGYSESIENMINRIRIYDDGGKQIGVVQNDDWIKMYGILQESYVKEKDKSPYEVAKGMLQDVKKDADVEAFGNVKCITGNGIEIKDSQSNMIGIFYIDQDIHTWQNGQHIMRLQLNFKNSMDEREG